MNKKGKPFFTYEDKQKVKNNLRAILTYYGAEESSPNWTCLKSRHKTPKNDLSVKENVCCCHCGLKGDSFNVIAEIEGYDVYKDFSKLVERGLQILNCDPTNEVTINKNNNKQIKAENSIKKQYKDIQNFNLTNIITENYKKTKTWQYKYFYSRGITSLNIFSKYKIIISNPKNVFPLQLLPQFYNLYAYRNIIPVWEDGKVVNCILRRDDKYSQNNAKVLNLKNLPLKICNLDYIKYAKDNDIIFITEGIFDGLTFEQMKYKCIVLNSTSMVNTFITYIKSYNVLLVQRKIKFIICCDNDSAGEDAIQTLDTNIRKMGIMCFIMRLKGYKDANEFYLKCEKDFFSHEIRKIVNNVKNFNK